MINGEHCIVQVILLEKGDIDNLMEKFECLNRRFTPYLSLNAKILNCPIAYLAYAIKYPDPIKLLFKPLDYANLSGANVIDFLNPIRDEKNERRLQPFQLENCIPLSDIYAEYGAYQAHITTVTQSITIGHTQKVFKNAIAIVLVMPIDHAMPNFNQPKYFNRFNRVAKKAFVNFRKCWIVAIDIGNGDFSNLLPGLETSFVAYSLFVGQTAFKMEDTKETIAKGFMGKSLILNSYTQSKNSTWATYEGEHHLTQID